MKPEHRAKLLEIAARRGEKGFSSVVGEALDAYLSAEAHREEQRHRALKLRGALAPREAQALRRAVESLRSSWR